jgi:hypothetical protein
MDTSSLKRRVMQAIEHAKKDAADRRAASDEASKAFDLFLPAVAVPLFRNTANILKSEGYPFTVFTPSGSVRLMSDRATSDFIELSLDTSGETPQVMLHVSRSRGRRVIEAEHAIGAPASLTEDALLDAVLKELEALVDR